MANQIDCNVFVKRDALKNPISYVQGTDLLPIVLHFLDFEIPAGATANVFVLKPDKTAFYGSATISGNDVTIDVDKQMFVVTGFNILQVEITSGGETLVNFAQPVTVKPNYKTGDYPESETKVEWIDEAIKQAQEAANEAQQAAKDSETAIENANTAITGANQAVQNANETAQELKDKAAAGDFDGPQGPSGTMTIGEVQTLQPDEEATVTNTGTPENAVLNFGIPRGEDGMTDLTAEYSDASEYTCQPTVNAPVVVKEVDGKTEQGENPSPDNPQVIKGVGGMGHFDGVWVQGNISSTGAIGTETTGITSANAIPCKQNDNIAVTYEDSIDVIAVAFYNASGAYISTSTSGNSVDTFTVTAPANAAGFKVNLRVVSGSTITPNGAKYCTVAINGKHQTGVEVHGAQLFDASKIATKTQGGATVTNNGDGSFTISGSGTVSQGMETAYTLQHEEFVKLFKQGTLTAVADVITNPKFYINLYNSSGFVKTLIELNEKKQAQDEILQEYLDSDYYLAIGFTIPNASAIISGTIKPMLYQDGDGTWQPYHHTTLTIPLTSPLYEGDKICYVKPGESYVNAEGDTVIADGILYGVYRENAEVVFDGSGDENIGKSTGGENTFSCTITNKVGSSIGGEQYLKCNKLTTTATNVSVSNMPDNSIKESGDIGSNVVILNISEAGTTVESMRTWLSTNPLTVVYRLAQPYFEPFTDQSIFYDLRTDDTLTYVYSNDPINPNVTVEVAKNSTGGYLLESYTQAQKNAISEASSQSRIGTLEQQLISLNTSVSSLGGDMNNLKTNTYALSGGTKIPEGADMNDYKTPGNYYCGSNAIAQTLINCPFTQAFVLKISYASGITYPLQTFINYINHKQATRVFIPDDLGWRDFSFLTPTNQL